MMSSREILEELPRLRADERREILERLCDLQDQDLVSGAEPSKEEKKLLDAALAQHEKDADPGRPWREVLRDLRANRAP